MYADFPWFLHLDRFAYLRGDRPALLFSLLGARLLQLLVTFLNVNIHTLLLRDGDALLLLLDSTVLLGDLLGDIFANLSARGAHLLLNILADLLGLIPADILPDRSTVVGLLHIAMLLFLLLVVLLFIDLLDLQHLLQGLDNRPLPLLGFSLLAHSLLNNFAFLLLNIFADFLSGGVALVLPDSLAFGWTGVALGLQLLLILDFTEGMRNFDAFLANCVGALFLSGGMAVFLPDVIAVVNNLVLALVVVFSVTFFMGNQVNDGRAFQLVKLFDLFKFFEKFGFSNCQEQTK